MALGPEVEIKTWMKILSLWPARNDADKRLILDLISSRLDGYAAATDAPPTGLVPELMELYPDAKVICTVRNAESWEKSIGIVISASTMRFLRFVLFPVPSMRFFVDYFNCLRVVWTRLYADAEPPTRVTYNRHIAWLKEVVPEDRLVFFDVKDGWEPLCKALGKEVPQGVPFPRINDGEAIDSFAKKQVQRGLARWAAIFATGAVFVGTVLHFRN